MAEMENLSTVYTQPTLHHVVWVFLSHCHGLRSTGLIQPFRFYPLAIYRWPPPPSPLIEQYSRLSGPHICAIEFSPNQMNNFHVHLNKSR